MLWGARTWLELDRPAIAGQRLGQPARAEGLMQASCGSEPPWIQMQQEFAYEPQL